MDEILKKIEEEIYSRKHIGFLSVYNMEAEKTKSQNQGEVTGLKLAKQIILSEQKEPCEYTLYDEDSNTWECNKCGVLWILSVGTPKDHDMNYCPVCGRSIK